VEERVKKALKYYAEGRDESGNEGVWNTTDDDEEEEEENVTDDDEEN